MQERLGRYEDLEEIASGGQATVYRARDAALGRVVALKVLHPHLTRDPQYRERFLREARIAATLTHPNTVVIYEIGQDGDRHFIAMEYLPTSLHGILRERGPMSAQEAVPLVRQIALALDVAHRGGVVHRDLKPQNILMTEDGIPKVTDFGIARAADFSAMTATGMVMGTPQYMSPEQARGERVDARTDIYALGVILYEMVTAHTPLEGRTPQEVLRHHFMGEVTPLDALERSPDIPANLRGVLRRALARDPAERFESAGAFAEALERARGSAATPASQTALPQAPPPPVAPPEAEPAPEEEAAAAAAPEARAVEVAEEEGRPEAPAIRRRRLRAAAHVATALLLWTAFLVVLLVVVPTIPRPLISSNVLLALGIDAVLLWFALRWSRPYRVALRIAARVLAGMPAYAAGAYALWVAVLLALSQDPTSPDLSVNVGVLLSLASAGAFVLLGLSVSSGRPLLPPLRRALARSAYGAAGAAALFAVMLLTPYGFAEAVVAVHLDGPASIPVSERHAQIEFRGAVVQLGNQPRRVVDVEVRTPSGETVLLSPNVDNHPLFPVSMWNGRIKGLPETGDYLFTGHDVEGQPKPVSPRSVTWLGTQPPDPPTNVRAELEGHGLRIHWDEVPRVPGSFDPNAGLGYYDISVSREGDHLQIYGVQVRSSPHVVPRAGIPALSVPDAAFNTAMPGGGHALEKWPDGQYTVRVSAHAFGPEGNQWSVSRRKNEWEVVDSSEDLRFSIEDRMLVLNGVAVPLVPGAPMPRPIATVTPVPREVPRPLAEPAGMVMGTFRVGNGPAGLAFDGANVWVANADDGTVTKLSLDGGTQGVFRVGEEPTALLFDGERIWITLAGENAVTSLSLDGREQQGAFPVGNGPMSLAFDGEALWVANAGDGTVTKVYRDGREEGTFPVYTDRPHSLVLGGGWIWVSNHKPANTVTRLNLGGDVMDVIPVKDPHSPIFDGESIWVANHDYGTVTKLRRDGEVLGVFPVGDGPWALAFDGESIWVANRDDGTVTALSLDGEVLGTFRVGAAPSALAFDGGSIWVANTGDGTVTRLSAGLGQPAPTPQPIGGGTLSLALVRDPAASGWNPYAGGVSYTRAALLSLTHNRLLRYSYGPDHDTHDFTVTPDLAESWEVTPDGLDWTFHLRQDVRFHDGTAFIAKDVYWSLQAALDTDSALPPSLRTVVGSVEILDDYTIVIRLNRPVPNLLHLLASPTVPILPGHVAKAAVEAAESVDGTLPPGTGPFVLEDYQPDAYVTLVRNPDYFRQGQPYLDGIKLFIVTDDDKRLEAFKAGTTDISGAVPIFDLGWDRWLDVQRQGGDWGYAKWYARGGWGLWFDLDAPPFDDMRVRKAVGFAIDQQAILDKLYGGAGTLQGPFHAALLGESWTAAENLWINGYDPEKAKRTLMEAGYPDRLKVTLLFPSFLEDYQQGRKVLEYSKEWLAQVGIEAEVVEVSQRADFMQALAEGKNRGGMHLYPFALGSSFYDLSAFLERHYAPGAPTQYAPAQDPEWEEMVKRVSYEPDQEKRRFLSDEAEKYLMDQVWAVPMPAPISFTAWWPRVQDFWPHAGPDLGPILEQVWLEGVYERPPMPTPEPEAIATPKSEPTPEVESAISLPFKDTFAGLEGQGATGVLRPEWRLNPAEDAAPGAGWGVVRQDGVYQLVGVGHAHAVVGDASWTDYRWEARLMVDAGFGHLHFRRGEEGSYSVKVPNVELWVGRTGEPSSQRIDGSGPALEPGRWYDLWVVVSGDRIEVYVDGDLRLAYTDPDPLPGGGLDFESFTDSVLRVQWVTVRGGRDLFPTPPATPTPAATLLEADLTAGGWTVQRHPEEGLNAVAFSGARNGWAVGQRGIILHTSDGGDSWQRQDSGATRANLQDVAFVDASNGWVVGDGGIVLHTSDGGASWVEQRSSSAGERLNGVAFTDAKSGWVVGDGGVILHTSDGGESWEAQDSGTDEWLWGVAFVDAANGWAVGERGVVLRTTDGGDSWWRSSSGVPEMRLRAVTFVDAANGWAVAEFEGFFFRTTNGGVSWERYITDPPSWLLAVAFLDVNNGWAVGHWGGISRTSDGGQSWTSQQISSSELWTDVAVASSGEGWVVGQFGSILHTADGGNTWETQREGRAQGLNGVSFIDGSQGWAVGEGNLVLQTSTAGASWESQPFGEVIHLWDVAFADAQNGCIGTAGIFCTHDGGRSWSRPSGDISNLQFNSITFADQQLGWAVGQGGTILHTSDGGDSWQRQDSRTGADLRDVTFVDARTGWAMGDRGVILHTSDGGVSWEAQDSGVGWTLLGVAFVDANNGWAVGDGGAILHTNDGGETWEVQYSGDGYSLSGVSFADANNGWAVGDGGVILHTDDGGRTWRPSLSYTNVNLEDVAFASAHRGWAVGEGGVILHYRTRSVVDSWRLYVKPDDEHHVPTPEDFGEYEGLVADGETLLEGEPPPHGAVYGFRTWVYVKQSVTIPVLLFGDDAAGLYVNGDLVASTRDARDRTVGQITLKPGWSRIETLVWDNGIGAFGLHLDVKIGDYVDKMQAEMPKG